MEQCLQTLYFGSIIYEIIVQFSVRTVVLAQSMECFMFQFSSIFLLRVLTSHFNFIIHIILLSRFDNLDFVVHS